MKTNNKHIQNARLKKRCKAFIKQGHTLQAIKIYHEETGAGRIESANVISAWEAELEKDTLINLVMDLKDFV